MRKKTKKPLLWLIPSLIVLTFIAFIIYGVMQTGLSDDGQLNNIDETGLYHYTNSPPYTSCSEGGIFPGWVVNNGYWFAGENKATIKTTKSKFEIYSFARQYYNDRGNPTSITPYSVDVYKDGVLIDAIQSFPNGVKVGSNPPSDQRIYRAYADDGTSYKSSVSNQEPRIDSAIPIEEIYLPEGVSGLNVIFGVVSLTAGPGTCQNSFAVHRYEIVPSADYPETTMLTSGFTHLNGYGVYVDDNPIRRIDSHLEIKLSTYTCTENEIKQIGSEYYICKNEDWKLISEVISITEKELATLNATLQEKIKLVEQYKGNLEGQVNIINKLNLSIGEQATLINSLEVNLEEKVALLQKLQATNEEQAKLIDAMKLSFSEQADIINALGNKVEDDAEIIVNLYNEADDQAKLIDEMDLSIDDQVKLISAMKLTIEQEKALINKLNINDKNKKEIEDKLREKEPFNYLLWSMVGGIGLLLVITLIVILRRKR